MIIAVLSLSGNVGKSTIAREVFVANLNNPLLIEVESVCSGNKHFKDVLPNYANIKANDFEAIYTKMVTHDGDVVLDIGASSIVELLDNLGEYYGSEKLIDLFVIPTTGDIKQLKDTIKTAVIMLINGHSIAAEKIAIIANRASPAEYNQVFAPILGISKSSGIIANDSLVIRESSIFNELEISGRTLSDILADKTDYMNLAKKVADGSEERKKYIQTDLIRMRGQMLQREFLNVFNNLIISEEGLEEEAKIASPEEKVFTRDDLDVLSNNKLDRAEKEKNVPEEVDLGFLDGIDDPEEDEYDL